jgi:hypothetical protein
MVQDMGDTEFYLGYYEETTPHGPKPRMCKYQDYLAVEASRVGEQLPFHRYPVTCVPVPGESEWVQQLLASPQRPAESHLSASRIAPKRRRDELQGDDVDMECAPAMSISPGNIPAASELADGSKRVRMEADAESKLEAGSDARLKSWRDQLSVAVKSSLNPLVKAFMTLFN